MKIEFIESTAVKGIFHAMQGDTLVGMVQQSGPRWRGVVYRADGNDYEVTASQRHAAEAFVRGNVAVLEE